MSPDYQSFAISTISHPRISTHFPYTTLFRSPDRQGLRAQQAHDAHRVRRHRIAHTRRVAAQEIALQLGERSEEHTSELQSLRHIVCRLLLEKKNHERRRKSRYTHKLGRYLTH